MSAQAIATLLMGSWKDSGWALLVNNGRWAKARKHNCQTHGWCSPESFRGCHRAGKGETLSSGLHCYILQQKSKLLVLSQVSDNKQDLPRPSWQLGSFTTFAGFLPQEQRNTTPPYIAEYPTKRSGFCSFMLTHFSHTSIFSTVSWFSLSPPYPKSELTC